MVVFNFKIGHQSLAKKLGASTLQPKAICWLTSKFVTFWRCNINSLIANFFSKPFDHSLMSHCNTQKRIICPFGFFSRSMDRALTIYKTCDICKLNISQQRNGIWWLFGISYCLFALIARSVIILLSFKSCLAIHDILPPR